MKLLSSAPPRKNSKSLELVKKRGPTEIRTRIVGFKVQSDSHYTIRPLNPAPLITIYKITNPIKKFLKFLKNFSH